MAKIQQDRQKTSGEEAHACERCGNPSAKEFGTHWVCNECYQTLSSSDLEEGGDDQWSEREEKSAA